MEHGLADDWAQHAARLSLESRAFPFITFDPDAGPTLSDYISLDGNPALDELWPTYSLSYVDDAGAEQTMELPLTIADWAATEGRFKRHFKDVKREQWTDEMIAFHEYVQLAPDAREGRLPFIWVAGKDRTLHRLSVSSEVTMLAEERLAFWSQLRQMAGEEVAPAVRAASSASPRPTSSARRMPSARNTRCRSRSSRPATRSSSRGGWPKVCTAVPGVSTPSASSSRASPMRLPYHRHHQSWRCPYRVCPPQAAR